MDQLAARIGRARGHRAIAAGLIANGHTSIVGWAADGDRPDEDARFEIGSITKVFTGVLLADMSIRGEVGLDDPLSAHLPAERAPRWRDREPTLLELATHRSGLPNTPRPLARRELRYVLGFGSTDPWAEVGDLQYRRLLQDASRKPPGGRMRYSSIGFGLLGEALAAAGGKSYEDLLRERVLDPLGMAHTSLSPAGQLRGHSRRGTPRPPLEDLMPPAGSLRSTVPDMLRFLQACLTPTPAMELAQTPQFRVNKRAAIGLGWLVVESRNKPAVVWHNGGTWGFASFAGFRPADGRAAVVLANTSRPVTKLGLKMIESR